MPREVRVNDGVNLQLANGMVTTAKVLAITDQDDVDVEYYNQLTRQTVDNAVRADSFPASVNEFWKMA